LSGHTKERKGGYAKLSLEKPTLDTACGIAAQGPDWTEEEIQERLQEIFLFFLEDR
jgi:hypothetical protein